MVKKIKEIEIKDGVLKCVVVGDKGEGYSFTNDVKSVVFSEMYVREEDGRMTCQVVLEV